jgi:hypothetical protein
VFPARSFRARRATGKHNSAVVASENTGFRAKTGAFPREISAKSRVFHFFLPFSRLRRVQNPMQPEREILPAILRDV